LEGIVTLTGVLQAYGVSPKDLDQSNVEGQGLNPNDHVRTKCE